MDRCSTKDLDAARQFFKGPVCLSVFFGSDPEIHSTPSLSADSSALTWKHIRVSMYAFFPHI